MQVIIDVDSSIGSSASELFQDANNLLSEPEPEPEITEVLENLVTSSPDHDDTSSPAFWSSISLDSTLPTTEPPRSIPPPRPTPWPFLLMLLPFFGGMLVGYARSVTGGLIGIDSFVYAISRKVYYEGKHAVTNVFSPFSDWRLPLLTSAVPLASLVSLWISYVLSFSWQRKTLLFFSLGSVLISNGLILTFSMSGFAIVLGLIWLGLAIGVLDQTLGTIYSELAPPNRVTAVNRVYGVGGVVGETLASLVGYITSTYVGLLWKPLIITMFPLTLILSILTILINETPRGLINKGRNGLAKNVLKEIGYIDVDSEYGILVQSANRDTPLSQLNQLFKGRHTAVLVLKSLTNFLPALTGVPSIAFLSPFLVDSLVHGGLNPFFAQLTYNGMFTVGVILHIFTTRWLSRRKWPLLTSVLLLIASEVALLCILLDIDMDYHITKDVEMILAVYALTIPGYVAMSSPVGWLGANAKYTTGVGSADGVWETSVSLVIGVVSNQTLVPLLRILHQQ